MDEALKQRLVGAGVLALAAVVVVPLVLGPPQPGSNPARQTPRAGSPAEPERVRSVALPPIPAPVVPAPAPTVAHDVANRRAPDPPLALQAPPTGWYVQLGTFSSADNAQKLVNQLQELRETALIQADGTYHLVRAGPFGSRAAADEARARLALTTGLSGLVRQVTAP